MIKDYDNLRRHCDTCYNIESKEYKVGSMTDKQLEIAERLLERKVKLTETEKSQLEAVKYVSKYRSSKTLERLSLYIKDRRTQKVTSAVNSLSVWGEKGYSLNLNKDKQGHEKTKSAHISHSAHKQLNN